MLNERVTFSAPSWRVCGLSAFHEHQRLQMPLTAAAAAAAAAADCATALNLGRETARQCIVDQR